MKHYENELVVEPGSKVKLKEFNPGHHGKHVSHKSALPELKRHAKRMDELQYLLYAENKRSVLIVLQGLSTSSSSVAEIGKPSMNSIFDIEVPS